jgi:hypothetical protein
MVGLLEEWRDVRSLPAPKSEKPKECWVPLARDLFKVKVDGAMAKSSGKGGGRMVIRDHDGTYIAGACYFSPPCQIPKKLN